MIGSKGYKGRGIVLHTLKYGENALVVHLLTDVGGRVSFIVQGVRSARGRGSKAALFQPLFAVEFEGLRPSRGELHRFREVRSGILLSRTPFDVRRSAVALFIAEVLYRLVREESANEALFERVWGAVEALDGVDDGVAVANFHLWFLTNLSRELGFMPGGDYREGDLFDLREGRFGRYVAAQEYALDRRQSWLLNELLRSDSDKLDKILMSRTERVSMLESLLKYYGYHLDQAHSIRSVEVLRELF